MPASSDLCPIGRGPRDGQDLYRRIERLPVNRLSVDEPDDVHPLEKASERCESASVRIPPSTLVELRLRAHAYEELTAGRSGAPRAMEIVPSRWWTPV